MVKKYWVVILVLLLVSLIVAVLVRHTPRDEGNIPKITISDGIEEGTREEDQTPANEVVFDVEYATEKSLLKNCDEYLVCIFSGSKTDMLVSSSIADTVNEKLKAVSPSGGYLARQLNIVQSGLTESTDGVVEYMAVAKVYCIDLNSKSFSYDIVIQMCLDDGVVVDFSLFSF